MIAVREAVALHAAGKIRGPVMVKGRIRLADHPRLRLCDGDAYIDVTVSCQETEEFRAHVVETARTLGAIGIPYGQDDGLLVTIQCEVVDGAWIGHHVMITLEGGQACRR